MVADAAYESSGLRLPRSGRVCTRPSLTARLRLFSLLTLLATLFASLRIILDEGIPQIEVRFVPRDVLVEVPVQVFVEHIIERVVSVPVR